MTCNRVVIINEGEIVAVDSVENLERKASGRPSWKIVLKPGENIGWRESIAAVTGSEIADIRELSEAFEFNLQLEKAEDFDGLFLNLTKGGAVFREISPVKATLEDVFLKLTAAEERKEAA